MPAILDASGLQIQTLAEIQGEIEAEIRAATGIETLVFTGDSLLGQLVGVMARREFDLQELAASVFDAFVLANAPDVPLKALVQLGGLTANAATQSTVTATLCGVAATVVPVGTVLSVAGSTDRFATAAAGTLVALPAWAGAFAYVVGDRVTSDGSAWHCLIAGLSGGVAPNGAVDSFVDGAVTWRRLGAGVAAVDVLAKAQALGAIPAPAFALTGIVTAVAGLASVINLLAAALGQAAETPDELRVRYVESYHLPGKSTLDALVAQLLDLDEIAAARVIENATAIIGGNGIAGFAPHSFAVIVDGTATAAQIGALVWANSPLGIETWAGVPGNVPVVVTDAQGDPQTVNYAPSAKIAIDVNVTITIGAVTGPGVAVDAAIGAVLVAGKIGAPALHWALVCAAADAAVAAGYTVTGIVLTLRRGAAAFAAANVAMAYYEQTRKGAVAVAFV